MSAAGNSECLADQNANVLPCEQSRYARHFPSYPYNVTRATLYSSYMNILLVFLPIGVIAGALHWADLTVFFLNTLAVIPLASLIAFSARELSGSSGVVLGRLLKATLSNIFEIIVGVVAVSRGQILIASSSLLGSMLFDSLLVLGSSIFFASIGVESLKFSKILTNIMSSLIMVASVSLIVPTAMSSLLVSSNNIIAPMDTTILVLSRSTAIVLLILFGVYVYFQIRTHTFLFLFLDPPHDRSLTPQDRRETNSSEEGHDPTLSPWAAGGVLFGSMVSLTLCISYLIGTSDGLAKSKALGISKISIGIIVIPIAGNIGKCTALVAISLRKRIDFAIRTVLNSILQISLLITPLLIIFGWMLGQPMMLNFDVFEAAAFFLAIIVLSYVIQDGKTNYFEGIMLVGTYIIIVVAFYIRSDPTENIVVT